MHIMIWQGGVVFTGLTDFQCWYCRDVCLFCFNLYLTVFRIYSLPNCSGITSVRTHETICGAGNWTRLSHLQGKCLNPVLSLAFAELFLNVVDPKDHHNFDSRYRASWEDLSPSTASYWTLTLVKTLNVSVLQILRLNLYTALCEQASSQDKAWFSGYRWILLFFLSNSQHGLSLFLLIFDFGIADVDFRMQLWPCHSDANYHSAILPFSANLAGSSMLQCEKAVD